MVASMEKYQTGANNAGNQTSDLGARINGFLDTIKNTTNAAGNAASNAAGKSKALKEEMAKLKQVAEDAIKPIISKIKEEGKDIEDTKQKIKEKAAEWRNYKKEGVKALSDITNEINKLKAEAANITLRINNEKDQNLGERLVEVNKQIAEINDQIAEKKANAAKDDEENASKLIIAQQELAILKQKQAEQTSKTANSEKESLSLSIQKKEAAIEALQAGNDPGILDLEKQITELQKERDFIQSTAPQKVLDEAIAYGNLSKAQQIVADAKKQEGEQLDENNKKMQAAIEKQMILQAQANQNGINDLKIVTGMKDGVMTASIELQKGKLTEIHDYENIALATEIANKQAAYKQDIDTLIVTLADKTAAQKAHLDEVK